MSRERQDGGRIPAAGRSASTVGHAGGVGKRTLTESLDAEPAVPRTSGSGAEPASDAVGAAGRMRAAALPIAQRVQQVTGVDVGNATVHTDESAATAASGVGARAFARGQDIYFGAGQLRPGTREGDLVIAHELAHTAQQRGGSGGCAQAFTTGSPDAAEREANEVAQRAVDGGGAMPVSAAPVAVFRFYPPEHVKLGDEATGNESTDIEVQFDDSTTHKLTFGQIVALADCFDSVADIKAKAALKPAIAVQYALSWKLGIGSEPAGHDDIKKQVRDHILEILATNMDHFGDEAKGNYKKEHTEALVKAFEAGASNDQGAFGEAVALEAFCQHYLSDLFAGGHVRTPRREIKDWYETLFPKSNHLFVANMTDWIVSYCEHQGAIPWWVPDSEVAPEVNANIFKLGGAAIATASVGDIVGAAHHNLDNQGLGVVSDVDESGNAVQGGYHWESKGDDHLKESQTTEKMAVAAMAASRKELDAARAAGKTAAGGKFMTKPDLLAARDAAIKGMQPYRAERFIPREDKGNAKNKQYNWHWGNLDDDLAAEVGRLVKSNLIGILRAKAGEQPEKKIIDRDVAKGLKHLHMELPVRAAMLDYCDHLDINPLQGLVEILGNAPAQIPPPKPKVGAWDSEEG